MYLKLLAQWFINMKTLILFLEIVRLTGLKIMLKSISDFNIIFKTIFSLKNYT